MSKFSDLLESHIKKIGLAESQLAEITGFSRSYIARLKNGQRISPDTEKMTRLFDALGMTVDEYKKLWNLYLEERLGKQKYDLNKKVLDFISSFKDTSKLQIETKYNHQIHGVRLIKGSEDVGYIIKIIIENEAAKEKGHLRLLMQPENIEAIAALKSGFKTNPKLKAEHLICLEGHTNQEHDNYYNISLLQKLVPVVLLQKKIDYNVYYYYDKISAHLNKFSAMPYFIITNEFVVNIDYDCKNALLYNEQEIIEFYKNMFDNLKRECNTLIKPSVKSVESIISNAETILNKSDVTSAELQNSIAELQRLDSILIEKTGPDMMVIGIIIAAIVLVLVIVVVIIILAVSGKSKKKTGPATTPSIGMGMTPPVSPVTPMPAYPPVDAGSSETTVLNQGAGETTVLGGGVASAYLIRKKTGEKISLNTPSFMIGKEKRRVNYCISDNSSISRAHAQITRKGSDYYIVDQNSTNFTFVNGTKSNPNQETLLTNGAIVKLADEEFEFHS